MDCCHDCEPNDVDNDAPGVLADDQYTSEFAYAVITGLISATDQLIDQLQDGADRYRVLLNTILAYSNRVDSRATARELHQLVDDVRGLSPEAVAAHRSITY